MNEISYLRSVIYEAIVSGQVDCECGESAIVVCHFVALKSKNSLVTLISARIEDCGRIRVMLRGDHFPGIDIRITSQGRNYTVISRRKPGQCDRITGHSIDDLTPIEEAIRSLKDDADMNIYEELRSLETELSELADDIHGHARRIAATLQQVRTMVVAVKREHDERDAQPTKQD